MARTSAIPCLRGTAQNFLFLRNINVLVDYPRTIATVERSQPKR